MTTWHEIRAAQVLLEDEAMLVLNKSAGISVMGERHDTDLVRLARDVGEEIIPVHRIDKVTSGALLLAKNLGIHSGLTRQFAARTVEKVYLTLTQSAGLPEYGTIELPLSVGRKNRVRVAAPREGITLDETTNRWSVNPSTVFDHARNYPSITTFTRIWGDDSHTLLAVRPVTGRRHQIRVHLAWIGHPIVGDPLFGGKNATQGARTALHSWRLGFDAAWSGDIRIRVEAPPGPDFWTPVADRLSEHAIAGGLELARQAPA